MTAPRRGLGARPALSECAVLLSAPLDKAQHFESPEFWRQNWPSWGKFKAALEGTGVSAARQLTIFEMFARLGAKVRLCGTSQDLAELTTADPALLMIVAHCEAGAEIVLWDRALFAREVAALVPDRSEMVLYGSVCEATGFVEDVKRKAPDTIVSFPGASTFASLATSLIVVNGVLMGIQSGMSIGEAFLAVDRTLHDPHRAGG